MPASGAAAGWTTPSRPPAPSSSEAATVCSVNSAAARWDWQRLGAVGRFPRAGRPDAEGAGGEFRGNGVDAGDGADLRRFLVQQIETQIERRLITAPTLEAA